MKNAMNFRPVGLMLLFCLIPLWAFAQSVMVKGVVKDTSGEAIIGASVLEKGTTNGTITDFDGNFALNVSKNAVLVVSFVGYKNEEIPVAGKSSLKITLKEDSKALEEVVVIGYGSARKSDVTGSIASVGGEKLREMPATNITYALQNRVAGVDMSQTSSAPGASMQIRIRGTRSLNASNDPLVVLDGIPFMGNLSDINPGDIKSMDILKDASSTAIYGSRGANGVILITTHKGAQGSPARFTYNGYAGMKKVFSKYPMMNGSKFAEMRKLAGKFENSVDESDDVDTDWQDLMLRDGYVNSHDVSVSGGTNGGGYSFGAAYYKDQGVIPTQNYTRYSLRGSFDQGVGKYFRFGLVNNTNYNVTKGSNIGLYGVLSMSPIADPYNADGTLKRTVKYNSQDESFVLTRGVVEELEDSWLSKTEGFGTYNNLFAEVKCPWMEGLKYRVNLGLNYRSTKGGSFTGEGINSTTADTPSTASLNHSETTNWTVENLLTYDRTFGKHQLNVVGMYSAEQTVYTRSDVAGRDIPAEYFQFYNIGRAEGTITVNPDNWNYQKSGLMSWMGRVMYTYDNRYMLMATVRADASSRLAKGHQWHTYPAVSAGWNIRQEEFMDEVDWIDILKLRVGYGQTSNQAVDPYKTWGRLATRPYNFGPTGYVTGYYVSELPNAELGWEYSSTWNFGLDFTLLRGRLSGTFEYYIQKTTDLLQSVSLPSTSGVSSYMANVGKTENKGFEFTVGYRNNWKDWSLDVTANISALRNKVKSLGEGVQPIKAEVMMSGSFNDRPTITKPGLPIGTFWGYVVEGFDNDGNFIFQDNNGSVNGVLTGKPDGKIDENDKTDIGNPHPDFTYGLNINVGYKNWDLTAFFQGTQGNDIFALMKYDWYFGGANSATLKDAFYKSWTPQNPNAEAPKLNSKNSSGINSLPSTFYVEDGSYFRCKNLQIGYSFNKKLLQKFHIESFRIYAGVQNLFTITKYPLYDPEVSSNVLFDRGVDGFWQAQESPHEATMNSRVYNLGVNLTF